MRMKATEAANAGNRQAWRRGRGRNSSISKQQDILPEFAEADETPVETVGKIIYPAMANAQVQSILQQHLGSLG